MLNQIYTGANIPTDRIKADAITGTKIADDQVDSEHFVAGSIDTEHLSALCVTAAKIAAGTITAEKYNELRNTYVFSDQDSLDSSYPFEMDFEIVSEMTAIESIKLSFRIREFRAYATTVPSGGGHTTPSGGGHTTPSGGGSTSGASGTPSGGGSTSGSATHNHSGSTAGGSGSHTHAITLYQGTADCLPIYAHGPTTQFRWNTSQKNFYTVTGAASHTHPLDISADGAHSHSTPNHTHPNHTHTTPSHTHTVSNHTHTVSDHTHSLTFGIYEDSQSPTLHYHIDNGAGYGGASGDYSTDQLDLDITSSISGTGFKRIKFDTDARCRISAWVLCKIDLTA